MKIFLGFILGIVISACASNGVIPGLDNRILLIDQDQPVLFFPYCEENKFFSRDECKDKQWKTDIYPINDKATRMALKDFVCVHKKRIF